VTIQSRLEKQLEFLIMNSHKQEIRKVGKEVQHGRKKTGATQIIGEII